LRQSDGHGITGVIYLQKIADHISRRAGNDALAAQETFADPVAAAAATANRVQLAFKSAELSLHSTDDVEVLRTV
jgi:hypothetical protein